MLVDPAIDLKGIAVETESSFTTTMRRATGSVREVNINGINYDVNLNSAMKWFIRTASNQEAQKDTIALFRQAMLSFRRNPDIFSSLGTILSNHATLLSTGYNPRPLNNVSDVTSIILEGESRVRQLNTIATATIIAANASTSAIDAANNAINVAQIALAAHGDAAVANLAWLAEKEAVNAGEEAKDACEMAQNALTELLQSSALKAIIDSNASLFAQIAIEAGIAQNAAEQAISASSIASAAAFNPAQLANMSMAAAG